MLDFNFRRPISGIRASMSWPSPVSSVSRILVTFVPTFRVVPPPPASLTDFTSVTVSPSARILPKASRIAASEAATSPSPSWLAAAGAHSCAHIGHANKAPISYVNSLARAGWKKVLNSRHDAHYGTSNILSGSDALQSSARFNYFLPHGSGAGHLAWIRAGPSPPHARLLLQGKAPKGSTHRMTAFQRHQTPKMAW